MDRTGDVRLPTGGHMDETAKRDEVRGFFRKLALIVALLALALLMSDAAQAVITATPTPGTPPHTATDGETSEVPSGRRLDSSPLRDEQVLASGPRAAGARSGAAADVAPLHRPGD